MAGGVGLVPQACTPRWDQMPRKRAVCRGNEQARYKQSLEWHGSEPLSAHILRAKHENATYDRVTLTKTPMQWCPSSQPQQNVRSDAHARQSHQDIPTRPESGVDLPILYSPALVCSSRQQDAVERALAALKPYTSSSIPPRSHSLDLSPETAAR